MAYIARENQLLAEHIENTANIAKEFAAIFGISKTAFTAGLLHDMGKYTMAFQDYLARSLKGEKVTRGEVIHALQGAKYVDESISETLIADMIGNAIATHHNGLFDSITGGERTLFQRCNKDEDALHYAETKTAYSPMINIEEIQTEILNVCSLCKSKKLNPFFMLHLMTKVMYSCLVDADRCDAAGIKPYESMPEWTELIPQFENHISKYSNKSIIDNIRKRISMQCYEASKKQPGIYTLSVPTGGGKTLSSLRFALEHAKQYGMKRIIYVIPYLSILDQTAAIMREIFNDNADVILEHHSNIEMESEGEEEKYNLLTSRWDSPIILTTMVQFLETIYSNKASKLRKFHNMSEAILIFDEIQALPIKCVHLFNDAVNFLQTFCKSTILLCTATQPHLHRVDRPVMLAAEPEVVKLTDEEMKTFERVNIKDETGTAIGHEQIAALVKKQIEQKKSTLVILNTKGDARRVFEQCKLINCEKVFLTTDLCPAHRLDILERLKKNLSPATKKLTICISTQLIEAGVDISFDCVIRAGAGMDSIIQAAGRCNRNKECAVLQPVIVIAVKDENLSCLPEINDGKKITERVFRENKGKNLLSAEVMNLFYYYYFFEQKKKMDYNAMGGTTTIYSLLNDNPIMAIAYRNRNNKNHAGLPCAFQTAADEFSVIEGHQIGIIVPYGDALKLVVEFQDCYDPKAKMRILKQLQKYTVSVYSQTLTKLNQAVETIDGTFYLLDPAYYDSEEQGLLLEQKLALLCV